MLICDNCGKPAEQNHSKTEISSMRDNRGFETKIDLCEECFYSFNDKLITLVNAYQHHSNVLKYKEQA